MTEGVIGLGTLLETGDGASPESYAPIAEVKDITGPGITREFAEHTHQQELQEISKRATNGRQRKEG